VNRVTGWTNLVPLVARSKGDRGVSGTEQPISVEEDARKVKRTKHKKEKNEYSGRRQHRSPIGRAEHKTNRHEYEGNEGRRQWIELLPSLATVDLSNLIWSPSRPHGALHLTRQR
jgi:hypothetical protein